jgi:predicted permease
MRWLWGAVGKSTALDTEMHDEMRFHVEMEAERLMRERGLPPLEARRRAHVAFGGVEKYRAVGRETRGLQWTDAMALDARLGVRMLAKHRWLTLVGGFAMAVAIGIGAACFEIFSELLTPALPFEDGARVVSLQVASAGGGGIERRVLHDVTVWREQLQSIDQVGAFRTVQHNLISRNAPPDPIKVAEMSASGFAVARTPPLLGRYLLPADERAGAPPVVVLGYQAWQSRFIADPQVIARTIDLGGVAHTVVGVMPDGFRFPVDHQFWVPLRANPSEYGLLQGPSLHVFGRLAPGVTLEEAQTELTTIWQRAAAANPETHARLQPRVLPYPREHVDLSQPALVWMLRVAQLLIGVLAFVVAVNVAILLYARTVARLGEIAVRTALGASRSRILAQLFIEALALALVGAAAGLVLAHVALERIQAVAHVNGGVPFWIHFDLSVETVIYSLALAVLAALIMGVLPGLEVTGRLLNATLHEFNSRTGPRLGPIWTTLVVAQVAVAVAVLPVAVYLSWQIVRMEVSGPGFAAQNIIVSTLALDDYDSRADTHFERRLAELTSRVRAEPGVTAVTFSSSVPGFAPDRVIEFEDGTALGEDGRLEVSVLDVAHDLFDAYGIEILAGRPFTAADRGPANVVIVNWTFAQQYLKDRDALGARFHYARLRPQIASAASQESYQIVGVVRDFPSFAPAPGSDGTPTVYHPAEVGDVHPVVLSVRLAGSIPAGFIDRFREIGAAVDPALQLRRLVPLSTFYNDVRSVWRYLAWGIGLVTTSVLLLSAAGIYALMSFTVAQRTREIGIRTALGAHPSRILLGIFGRAGAQLAVGLLVGSLVSSAAFSTTSLGLGRSVVLLVAVAAIMLAVGLLAAFGPARRGLRIQAAEALRVDS